MMKEVIRMKGKTTMIAAIAAVCVMAAAGVCYAQETENEQVQEQTVISEEAASETEQNEPETQEVQEKPSEEAAAEEDDEYINAETTNYEKLKDSKKIKEVKLNCKEYTYPRIRPANFVEITLNDGTRLPNNYFDIIRSDNDKIGTFKLTVRFKSDYLGCPDKTLTYTVIPPKPYYVTMEGNKYSNALTGVGLTVEMLSGVHPQTIYIKYARSSNMKGYKTKAFKPAEYYNITGLAKNTVYYAQAYCGCKGNDGRIYYSYSCVPVKFITASTAYAMPTLANSKTVYAQLKKGKTFSINKRVDEKNAREYVKRLWNLYPYYHNSWNPAGYVVNYTYEYNGLISRITFRPVNFSKLNTVQKKVDVIVKGAKKCKSNEAKVKYVNKKIKATCTYSYKAANRRYAYGCLVDRKAVCAGYAESFAWCMNDLGISNAYQYNTKKDHIWNKVYIKHKKKTRWWHVDVTWNDTQKTNKYLLTKTHTMK